MTKCKTMCCCKTDECLTFDVDFRIEQSARIREISETLIPLKDDLGRLHVSANIAYLDAAKEKWQNLGCYLEENDTTRTVKIMFPAGVTVNVLDQGAEKPINVLEYHIDKFTEIVTEEFKLENPQETPEYVEFNVAIKSENKITVADDALSMLNGGIKWSDFQNYLQKTGKIPSINLYTDRSECFVPAIMKTTIDKDAEGNPSNTISGTVTIEYHKEIEGVLNLVTETMILNKFGGRGSIFQRTYSAIPVTGNTQGCIIIPVDFTQNYEVRKNTVLTKLTPWLADNLIYLRPIYFNVIYKTDYTPTNTVVLSKLIPLTNTPTGIRKAYFRGIAGKISDVEGYYTNKILELGFNITTANNSISYAEDLYLSNNYTEFNVAINSDNRITTADENLSITNGGIMWQEIFSYIENTGKIPSINLYTDRSECFVPAIMKTTIDKDAEGNPSNTISGTVTIEYHKEIEGILNLVTETIILDNFYGNGSTFQRTYSAIPLNTNNTPLGSSEFTVLDIDIRLASNTPPATRLDFNKQEFLDSIYAQTALVTDWSKPIVLKFISGSDAYFSMACHTDDSDSEEFTIQTKVSDNNLINLLKGDTFKLHIIKGTIYVWTEISTQWNLNVLFLRENGDRQINNTDLNGGLKGSFMNLSDFAERGNYPVLYLRTARSENYYPAYYGFTNEKPLQGNIPTKIGCIYVKEADGKKYLVTDELICAEGIKWNSTVTYNYSEIPLN